MQVFSKLKVDSEALVKLLPLFAFAFPLALLFLLNPADPFLQVNAQDSFSLMWKGRTFELFFIWLILLEFILSWENFKLKISCQNKAKLAAFAVALTLPTVYIVSEYYLGLNAAISNWSMQRGVAFYYSMPVSMEYLALAAFFFLVISLCFGKKGLLGFALPGVFAALVGVIYTIDNVFPYGQFTPFQILVPTTASLAAKTLNLMGCATSLTMQNGMPTLQATGPLGTATFAVAWPCAGIESLLIYTAVVLLFLQQIHTTWKTKAVYFAAGAVVTYFINVLRIVTIFTIGMKYGTTSSQVETFHSYYGPLYSISWIIAYPLVIYVIQGLWQKRKMAPRPSDVSIKKLQPERLNPA